MSQRTPPYWKYYRIVNYYAVLQVAKRTIYSEDRGLKVRFSLVTIVFETFELILCQMLSSQGKNAPSNPYPHYLVRLATSRVVFLLPPHIYYAVNPSSRGKMSIIPRKLCQRRGGRHSKSPCDSNFPRVEHILRHSINSVQTRCIVKGEAQKSPLFWRFSGGGLIFSGSPVL